MESGDQAVPTFDEAPRRPPVSKLKPYFEAFPLVDSDEVGSDEGGTD